MADLNDIRIFHGSANPELALKVAENLNTDIGKAYSGRFSDGEVRIEIEENVRGRDIYLIQSTCDPVNENLVELLMMGDAFRRASAASITAVVPYFGYARQDRRVRSSRVPISAKVVADMMQKVGFSRFAKTALTTFWSVKGNHMISDLNRSDPLTNFFYHPAPFVAKNCGENSFRIASGKSECIGMADSGCHNSQ